MRSIGFYLQKRLFWGFTLVLAAGSVALAVAMRFLDVREFDAALKTKAETLSQLIFRHPQAIEVDFADEYLPEFEREENPDHFQVRFVDGTPIERSGRLGGFDLPFFPDRIGETVFRDVKLPDGRRGRCVQIGVMPRTDEWAVDEDETDLVALPEGLDDSRPYVVLAVAWGRQPLDVVLLTIYLIVLGEMILLILILMGVVHAFLRRGFRPIEQMNEQIRELGPKTLDRRVRLPSTPAELQPVLGALNGFLDDLQSAFARERRFTSNVAHELRTPVAEFRLACEIGAQWPEDPVLVRTRFEELRQSALDMERKVNGLLELSRLDRNAVSVKPSPVRLRTFAQERWECAAGAGNPLCLRLDNRIPEAAEVLSDEFLLDIALGNLLQNALTYSRPDTTVILDWTAAPEGGGVLGVSNQTDHLEPKDLENLFERFWRKDPARTGGERFGLGLSIVQALAERLGLDIQADLDADRRLTLRLAFPAAAVRRGG